ncbi:hypothetical protein O3M35_007657 [Rhynocoris fuscipes]|uniref:NADH-cytochrome b5 reductase n=1 Tax=Rhynocoris fuscipes TaxID=488301 RepID=A0AAW1DBK6_9HEMI
MSMNVVDKPEEPNQEDCCQNGCTPCVFDIYRAQLELWEKGSNSVNSSVVRYDVLSQTRFKPFTLTNTVPLTQDTNLYRFQPVVEQNVDLQGLLPYHAGQHLVLRLNRDKDKIITRAYTIISKTNSLENCSFEVLIKLYNNGVMSNYIKSLKIGEITYWRGPYGDFQYEPNKYRNILMICIGTGIAPMYAIIQEIVQNENDETVIKLLYGCRNPSNIILREELYKLSSFWNFNYICYLSEGYSSNEKKFSENLVHGKISKEHIRSYLNYPLDNLLVLICGTTNFTSEISDILVGFDVPIKNVHVF